MLYNILGITSITIVFINNTFGMENIALPDPREIKPEYAYSSYALGSDATEGGKPIERPSVRVELPYTPPTNMDPEIRRQQQGNPAPNHNGPQQQVPNTNQDEGYWGWLPIKAGLVIGSVAAVATSPFAPLVIAQVAAYGLYTNYNQHTQNQNNRNG
jgi:hypothetical protein